MNHDVAKTLPADAAAISRAAEILRAGGLVGLPTETVYGLAGDATSPAAVARIYAAKGRPRFNPLIAHLPALGEAMRHAVFPQDALRLAGAFWPGPLTLVLPFKPGSPICDLARAGLDSVALRVPSHPVARAVLQAAGIPVAAPSANRSGRISPTSAADVALELGGEVELILDGGPTEVGVESTIVAVLGSEPVLLRPGGVPRVAIERLLGRPLGVARHDDAAPVAPGMLSSHYAPRAAVRLNADHVAAGEALLAFGPRPLSLPEGNRFPMLNLSEAGDSVEAAANLFRMLRALDAAGPATIAVMPIPGEGLGEAINDRLRRAAAPR